VRQSSVMACYPERYAPQLFHSAFVGLLTRTRLLDIYAVSVDTCGYLVSVWFRSLRNGLGAFNKYLEYVCVGRQ